MEHIIRFLAELRENNNREWFESNKSSYLKAKNAFEVLITRIIPGIQESDPGLQGTTAKKSIFRIYRDVRFSHDKSPYKTNMGAYMVAGGKKSGRGGYYLHVEPGGCFMAGGIYQPLPENLKKIRKEIYHFPEEFEAILKSPGLAAQFTLFDKNLLKRPPQGFPADFKYIDYLKYKHYVLTYEFEDNWLNDSGLEERLIERFKLTVPLNEFLNRAIDHAE